MALGKRQKEDLAKLIDLGTRPMREGHIRFEVMIGQRFSSREIPFSGGYVLLSRRGVPITVTPIECYEEADYPMQCEWIAFCEYDYTALEKGQEIARYLVEQGIPRERVKLLRR
jgi:hypothetical protein